MGTYFLLDSDCESGPHEPIELRELWIAGELDDDAKVRSDGSDSWEPLAKMMPTPDSQEGQLRHYNLRVKSAVQLIQKLPADTDYVDLTAKHRAAVAEIYTTIVTKPLEEWSSKEKAIYKFWRRMNVSAFDASLGHPVDHQLTAQISELSDQIAQLISAIRAVEEQSKKTKWAARMAAFALWLLITFGITIIVK